MECFLGNMFVILTFAFQIQKKPIHFTYNRKYSLVSPHDKMLFFSHVSKRSLFSSSLHKNKSSTQICSLEHLSYLSALIAYLITST